MNFSDDVRSAFRRGETDAVVRMSEAEIERARSAGDPAGEVEARYSLARVAIRGGDLPGGEARAREALEVALRSGDRSLEERPRHVLAAVARMSGDLLRARGLYLDSIALNESLGQSKMVNSEYHNLAFCELGLGNLDAARKLFAEGRERVFRNGWADFVPYVCVAGAALGSAEGDHTRAARMIGVADAAFASLGQVPDPDDAADLAKARAAAIEALGPDAFGEEYARGQLLDPRTAFADDRR
ncbi:tetratricopeptide repeat protein [Micromonospora sp. NPDC051006]|uniref:tetratricopeptide repeat protein n=1 Tax=Micromonospora sp. NPDC051006 TaxID=3364283 RepID=UPI003796D531